MNMMTCKGYSARIDYDDEDGILVGRIAGIRDGVGFHADNIEDLKVAFEEAVDDYLGRQGAAESLFRQDDVPGRSRDASQGRAGCGTLRQKSEPVGGRGYRQGGFVRL